MKIRRRQNKQGNALAIKATDIAVTILVICLAGYFFWRQEQTATTTAGPLHVIEGLAAVGDGDSIRISGQRIRLVGIDAPEFQQYCEKDGQQFACGQLAADHLQQLINGQTVACKWIDKDLYNRILGHCFAGETDLNHSMVVDGWAVSYSSYPFEERVARNNKRGMWQWHVQRPYEWRRAHPRS